MARVAKAAPDWGVIFFGYDWFAAYSAAAAANVAWDILIPHYKAPLPFRICHLASASSLLVIAHAMFAQAHNRDACKSKAPLPDTAF